MDQPGQTLLRLEGVSKAYGPKPLFNNLDLSVQAGQVYLLCGANGAGKSTLLKIMAGLLDPDQGLVELLVPVDQVGYLGHATFIYPGLTARENLLFWGKALGLSNTGARAEQALDRVGLLRHADERAEIFSRGMSQRLNLARLLQMDAQLWLLDEPGTGLDQAATTLLRELIAQAAAKNKGVVWISHQAATDAALANQVLELQRRALNVQPGGVQT